MRARVGTIMLCILSKLEASWSAVLSYFIRRPFAGRRTKKQQPNRPPHVAQSLVPALGALYTRVYNCTRANTNWPD